MNGKTYYVVIGHNSYGIFTTEKKANKNLRLAIEPQIYIVHNLRPGLAYLYERYNSRWNDNFKGPIPLNFIIYPRDIKLIKTCNFKPRERIEPDTYNGKYWTFKCKEKKKERLTIKSQVEKRYFLNKVQKCILDIF